MRTEIRAALESARSKERPLGELSVKPMRHYSFETVRHFLHAVLQELPDDMTVMELREELDLAENQ